METITITWSGKGSTFIQPVPDAKKVEIKEGEAMEVEKGIALGLIKLYPKRFVEQVEKPKARRKKKEVVEVVEESNTTE